ncbi:U3 small nucleolar RNA-interacting protein 2 [Toxorhynchites rutilus septentrionalis]|uniref:U3 small nucleolar RNA-interacting protein 2 n=1 Tax=Toxorhynchites rutilus septentrionalis TaxID=329112 RepID=UPI00247A7464|nr:U3 small nucleolar RNA-interacting protein 2 [Toxorhynchites rutilus septentrionalis]
MSSFFLKGKPRTATKRKFDKTRPGKKSRTDSAALARKEKEESEEELDSDEEEERTVSGASKKYNFGDGDDEAFVETAQDKRLRLAQKYLKEVEENERAKEEDADLHDSVAAALREDYLDSIGKLYRAVAESYKGYDLEASITLRFKQQRLSPTCLCLSDDDKFLYVANKNGIVVRWDLEKKIHLASTKHQRTAVHSLAISHDLKFLVVADGTNEIKVLDGETLAEVNTLSGHSDVVTGVVFRTNTHQLYSCSKDRTVKVWSLDEMLYVETLYGHQTPVTSIDALSRERAITSGGSDCSVRIWKIVEESQLMYNSPSTVGSIECVRLIGDEHFISCGTDGSLSVWSSGKKKPLNTVQCAHGQTANGEANWISAIATLLNTDVFASGSCDGFVRVWKLAGKSKTIEPLMEIPLEGFVNALAFTSDGKSLIVCTGQEHRLGRWWTLKQAKNRTIVVPLILAENEKITNKKKKKAFAF